MKEGRQSTARTRTRGRRVLRAEGRPDSASHRGFTLFELLIAIAIVVTLSLLVFPVMSSRLAERGFISTAEQIESQLLLARAEAMSSRRALEVRYDSDLGRITVHEFLAGSGEVSAGERNRAARQGGEGENLLDSFYGDQDEAVLVTAAAWGSLRVPSEMRLLDELPERIEEDFEVSDSLDLSAEQLESIAGESRFDLDRDPARDLIRLAVFLSDGSALVSRPVWLLDQDGRRMQIEVNPWTGLPRLDRTATDRSDDMPEEDDEYAVDDEEPADRDSDSSAATQPTSPSGGGGS